MDRGTGQEQQFVAHVPLPDRESIEELVLAKKKRDLINRYLSPEQQAAEAQAKAVLLGHSSKPS